MSILIYILVLLLLLFSFIYFKLSKNLITFFRDIVLNKYGTNRTFILIKFFIFGFFLQYLSEWYFFFLEHYNEEYDLIILSALVLTYIFSTQKCSALNVNNYIFILQKITKTLLGLFIFFIFVNHIYKLLFFGYIIEPTIITFNYYIPLPLKLILFVYYRIEIILWSIAPFIENSLTSFFGIQTNFVLTVFTEIIILSFLLLVLYQCWFKKKL